MQKITAVILHKLNDNDFLNYKHHYNDLTQTDKMIAEADGIVKVHKSKIAAKGPHVNIMQAYQNSKKEFENAVC